MFNFTFSLYGNNDPFNNSKNKTLKIEKDENVLENKDNLDKKQDSFENYKKFMEQKKLRTYWFSSHFWYCQ